MSSWSVHQFSPKILPHVWEGFLGTLEVLGCIVIDLVEEDNGHLGKPRPKSESPPMHQFEGHYSPRLSTLFMAVWQGETCGLVLECLLKREGLRSGDRVL